MVRLRSYLVLTTQRRDCALRLLQQGWRHLRGPVGPGPPRFGPGKGKSILGPPTTFGKNGPKYLKPIYWAPPHSKT